MSKALAQGRVTDGHVVVAEPSAARRLHDKAVAGTPQPGGLRLSLVEAAYCAGAGWLDAAGADGQATQPLALLGLAADPRATLTAFLVYRDLRERGFVARHAGAPGRFNVWPRGAASGPTLFQTACWSAADPVNPSDLLGAAAGGVWSVVDEDSAVTHYQLGEDHPAGDAGWRDLPPAAGHRVADRILVHDPVAVRAYAAAYLGTPTAGGVFLSPIEAEALRRTGKLAIEPLQVPPEQVATYGALRAAGVAPKSGLRFGAHLRAYRGDPDATHADWLVHCAGATPLSWSDLARGVRLAHGVKKQFLVAASSEGGGVRFVRLGWFRP